MRPVCSGIGLVIWDSAPTVSKCRISKRRLLASAATSVIAGNISPIDIDHNLPSNHTTALVADSASEIIASGLVSTAALTGAVACAVNPFGYAYAQWGYWAELNGMGLAMGLCILLCAVLAGVGCCAMDRKQKIEYYREGTKRKLIDSARLRRHTGKDSRRSSVFSNRTTSTDTEMFDHRSYSLCFSDES